MLGAWTIGAYLSITLTGIGGNALMLATLIRDAPLKDVLGRILHVLLMVHSSVDLLYSLVGVPLYALSFAFPYWPVWSEAGVCHVIMIALWQVNYTSQWYLLVLAVTRLIAVVWPLYFRNRVRNSNKWLAAFICAAPVGGSVVFTGSMLIGWVEIAMTRDQLEGTVCSILAVEGTGDLYYRLESFSMLALPLGLLIYIGIVIKLSSSKNKVANVDSSVAIPPANAVPNNVLPGRAIAIKRVRMLATCFIVNLVLMGPVVFTWLSGIYYSLFESSPRLAHFFDITYIASGAVNPVVYAIVSGEIRAALGRTLGCA